MRNIHQNEKSSDSHDDDQLANDADLLLALSPSSARRGRDDLATHSLVHKNSTTLRLSRRQSLLPPCLLLTALFMSPTPLNAEHEAEFMCPNTDVEGPCVGTDHSEDVVEDEQTLLDLFGEVAKEFLTQRVIPPTEANCHWDWRYARCEPFCKCSFQPEWGDFHLGRCCRLRKQDRNAREERWDGKDTCDIAPNTPYVRVFNGVMTGARATVRKAKSAANGVAEKFAVKSRLGRARGDACALWKERAKVEGRDLNEFQRKLCSREGAGKLVDAKAKEAAFGDTKEVRPGDGVTIGSKKTEASEDEVTRRRRQVDRAEDETVAWDQKDDRTDGVTTVGNEEENQEDEETKQNTKEDVKGNTTTEEATGKNSEDIVVSREDGIAVE